MTITRIRQRRDTAANWTSIDPTLSSGEFGVETDTGKIKLGDGSTAWSALDYLLNVADLRAILDGTYATLASPALTGTPTAPTAPPGTNTTQVASTAFVKGAVDNATYAPPTALYLPGVSGNYVSTPDDASLDITGDIDLRVHVALADWTPASQAALVSKNAMYELAVQATSGLLVLTWFNGSVHLATASSVAPTVTDGADLWVRATLDVDNGAGGRTVRFFTSSDGATWTQLGSDVTDAGVTALATSADVVAVGSRNASAFPVNGAIYRAQVRNGIDGILVADYRADVPMGPRYRDSTGKVWTINGSAWTWMVA